MPPSIDLIRFQSRLKTTKEHRDNVTNAVRSAQAKGVRRVEDRARVAADDLAEEVLGDKEKKPKRRIVVV